MSLSYKHANEILSSQAGHVLWLGDLASAEDSQWIHDAAIKTVITAGVDMQPAYHPSVDHYRYPLHDTKVQNISKYFDQVTARIATALKKGSILVHCGAGVSRSATFVIAYLIKHHNLSFHEALRFTRSKRPQICPNLGFELQLKKYGSPGISLTPQDSVTRQNFYHQPISLQTFVKFPVHLKATKNESFPLINRAVFKSGEKNPKQVRGHKQMKMSPQLQLYQPMGKGAKKQSDLEHVGKKPEDMEYIRRMAQFRFGLTNTSNWGIF